MSNYNSEFLSNFVLYNSNLPKHQGRKFVLGSELVDKFCKIFLYEPFIRQSHSQFTPLFFSQRVIFQGNWV